MDYYIAINGVPSTFMNDLNNLKDALYDLFGDTQIAMDDQCMEAKVCGVTITIHPVA